MSLDKFISSLVEFSDSFLFFDGLDSVELDLTLGASFESSDGFSDFLVVVKVVSEGGDEIVEFRLILKDKRWKVLLF
jgi:hypothetical protein